MSGRGRGRRSKLVKDVVEEQKEVIMDEKTEVNTETIEEANTATIAEPKPKRTSKKKQFPVVAVITPDGIEGSLMQGSRRPLIVHLPIQSKDVSMNDMPVAYDPLPPSEAEPYDSFLDNPFSEDVECVQNVAPPSAQDAPILSHEKEDSSSSPSNTVDFYSLKSTLLIQFKDSSDIKTIPTSSTAACYWCCYTFSHRPVVLPIRDTGDHLIVTGNFCCPECAMAQLFDMHQDSHTRWEQLALLYRVYGEACNGKIQPAPPRSILSMFGGSLSIQEYRQLIRSYKVRVDLHLPPMVSILATMDTKPIDFYDASLTKNVSETVKERLQKAEEVLRLRRTKPLKAWESTLDACINLKIKHDPIH